jgi:hypothetical protein
MQQFAAELAWFHTSIHKAAVGGKPVYRVRVAGFSSRDEAIALCQKVQSGGGILMDRQRGSVRAIRQELRRGRLNDRHADDPGCSLIGISKSSILETDALAG